PLVDKLIRETVAFFAFHKAAATRCEELRKNLSRSLSAIYQIRNSIVHDAFVDEVLFDTALDKVENLANLWLHVLSSLALTQRLPDSETILSRLYVQEETLETRLKCGQIHSLDDWPIDIRRVPVSVSRRPLFDYDAPVII